MSYIIERAAAISSAWRWAIAILLFVLAFMIGNGRGYTRGTNTVCTSVCEAKGHEGGVWDGAHCVCMNAFRVEHDR